MRGECPAGPVRRSPSPLLRPGPCGALTALSGLGRTGGHPPAPVPARCWLGWVRSWAVEPALWRRRGPWATASEELGGVGRVWRGRDLGDGSGVSASSGGLGGARPWRGPRGTGARRRGGAGAQPPSSRSHASAQQRAPVLPGAISERLKSPGPTGSLPRGLRPRTWSFFNRMSSCVDGITPVSPIARLGSLLGLRRSLRVSVVRETVPSILPRGAHPQAAPGREADPRIPEPPVSRAAPGRAGSSILIRTDSKLLLGDRLERWVGLWRRVAAGRPYC